MKRNSLRNFQRIQRNRSSKTQIIRISPEYNLLNNMLSSTYIDQFMNKKGLFIFQDPFSPEENLKDLSLLDDDEANIGKHCIFSQRETKKVSMIEGWIKLNDKQVDTKVELKKNVLQCYRKLIRPSINAVRSHYSHIVLTSKPININQIKTEGQTSFSQVRKRPMSSTVPRKDHFKCIQPQIKSIQCKQKVYHEYLKKNCGIKNSKKNLQVNIKKKTIQTLVYPVFESSHFNNPQRLVPNIGRISYLVKLNKRHSVENKY